MGGGGGGFGRRCTPAFASCGLFAPGLSCTAPPCAAWSRSPQAGTATPRPLDSQNCCAPAGLHGPLSTVQRGKGGGQRTPSGSSDGAVSGPGRELMLCGAALREGRRARSPDTSHGRRPAPLGAPPSPSLHGGLGARRPSCCPGGPGSRSGAPPSLASARRWRTGGG